MIQTIAIPWRSVSRLALPIWCTTIFTLAFTLAPSHSWSQHEHKSGQSTAPAVGTAAIAFDLKSLDGKPVGLANFRGKPLIMNFFASWCDPYRDEMPLVNELASKAAQDGYSVLASPWKTPVRPSRNSAKKPS
jgi:thiol-disulfide isomerase/thioredoxin